MGFNSAWSAPAEKFQISRAPGALTLAGSNRGETCCVFARPSGPIVLVLETGQKTKLTLDQSESRSGTSDFSDRSFDKDRCAPRTRTRTRTISNPPTGNFPTRKHLELWPGNPLKTVSLSNDMHIEVSGHRQWQDEMLPHSATFRIETCPREFSSTRTRRISELAARGSQ